MKGSFVTLTFVHCHDHRLWVSGSLPSTINRSLGLVKNLSVGLTLRLTPTIYPTSSNLSHRDAGCCGNWNWFLWKWNWLLVEMKLSFRGNGIGLSWNWVMNVWWMIGVMNELRWMNGVMNEWCDEWMVWWMIGVMNEMRAVDSLTSAIGGGQRLN